MVSHMVLSFLIRTLYSSNTCRTPARLADIRCVASPVSRQPSPHVRRAIQFYRENRQPKIRILNPLAAGCPPTTEQAFMAATNGSQQFIADAVARMKAAQAGVFAPGPAPVLADQAPPGSA